MMRGGRDAKISGKLPTWRAAHEDRSTTDNDVVFTYSSQTLAMTKLHVAFRDAPQQRYGAKRAKPRDRYLHRESEPSNPAARAESHSMFHSGVLAPSAARPPEMVGPCARSSFSPLQSQALSPAAASDVDTTGGACHEYRYERRNPSTRDDIEDCLHPHCLWIVHRVFRDRISMRGRTCMSST